MRIFDQALEAVLSGDGVSRRTGLDPDTENILFAIAWSYPDVPAGLVAEARRAFAGQLDGSNAAARRASKLGRTA